MSISTVPTEAQLDHLSDADLIARSAERLRTPRAQPADSLVLHAPLDLLARAALLPRVRASDRAAARERIIDVADQFVATGPAVAERPETSVGAFDSIDEAAADLVTAIDAGDLVSRLGERSPANCGEAWPGSWPAIPTGGSAGSTASHPLRATQPGRAMSSTRWPRSAPLRRPPAPSSFR